MYSDASILIVEDEKIPAIFLQEILEEEGFTVAGICDRAEDAIEAAIRLKPDIIFMDIVLKGAMSGCEAALKISSLMQTKIIFLTAHSDDEMIEYALEAGAVNYLIKPYREKQIIATLQVALSHRKEVENKEINIVKMIGDYEYDVVQQVLSYMGVKIEIGAKSTRLLDYLCRYQDTIVSKEQLSHHVYGEDKQTSAMRALISRLNKTLGIELISNSSGLGYSLKKIPS